jgi:pimeloyl-ACP methyl ester carboxylesterase
VKGRMLFLTTIWTTDRRLAIPVRTRESRQTNRQKIVRLQNGAVVAVDEYGDPTGVPVMFCHGWPSARTMARIADEPARELGVRILSPDRPGISGSSMQPNRKLSDWPPLLEQLVNHFDIDEFRMLAISGGAPYAYATALAMPERVRAVAVVGGVIPFAELKEHDGLLPLYRWLLAFYRNQPQLLRGAFHLARLFLSLRPPVRLRPLVLKMLLLRPCDAASLRDDTAFEAIFESQRRAWRGSAEGVMADAQIYAQPWGFAVEDLRVPVRLWHGKEDRAFAVRLAQDVANRLPNCTARFVENEGHYSLPIRHMREILQDLISC